MILDDHLSRAARVLLTGTAGTTGRSFYEAMAKSLTEALDIRIGMVGELNGPTAVRSRALWDGSRFAAMDYDLKGTPCEQVMYAGACHYGEGVARRFPDDRILADMQIESYLGIPIHSYEGKPLGIIVGLHDEPTAFSADLQSLLSLFAMRAAAELERERSERRRHELELQAMQGQKLESLGLLAGGVAHDFNNLLVGISGNLELAMLEAGIPEAARQSLQDAFTAARRAGELTKQLLLYAGKGRMQRAALDLNELVREMDRLLGSAISKKAKLSFDLAPDLPRVNGDATQIRQVVMNLLTNASDALEGNVGTIDVRTAIRDLDVGQTDGFLLAEHHHPGRYVALTVRDSGIGMDQATRNRIFDPFFSTKPKGRGLGLAATLGALRSHHALLRLESEVGKGTTFEILFPASAG